MSKDLLQPGDTVSFQGRLWRLERRLGEGKSAVCSLAVAVEPGPESLNSLVVKQFRSHPQNYIPLEENREREFQAYHNLKSHQIPVAELYGEDAENNLLFKEFISGETAARTVAQGALEEHTLRAFARLALSCESRGFTLDYFPTNYMFRDDELVYIDYEMNPYSDEWNLRNWGIYYWFNPRGMARLLDYNDPDLLNRQGEPRPITEPFEAQIETFWAILGVRP